MEFDVRLTNKDWNFVIWIGITLVSVAWFMTLLDVVYAPIPMFAASIVAGFLFRGRPKHASLAGALSGLFAGWLAEWAFYTVRMQNRLFNWAQLDPNEQLGLAVAEILMYAALLSFFAAFFSWGTSKDDQTTPVTLDEVHPTEPLFSPRKTDNPTIDIPLFKKDPEPESAKPKPKPPEKK